MTGSPYDLGQDSPELSRSAPVRPGRGGAGFSAAPGLTHPAITTSDLSGGTRKVDREAGDTPSPPPTRCPGTSTRPSAASTTIPLRTNLAHVRPHIGG